MLKNSLLMLATVLLIASDLCTELTQEKLSIIIAKAIIGAFVLIIMAYILRDANVISNRLNEIVRLEKKDAKKVNQLKPTTFQTKIIGKVTCSPVDFA